LAFRLDFNPKPLSRRQNGLHGLDDIEHYAWYKLKAVFFRIAFAVDNTHLLHDRALP
jgi:hypothetical protein